MSRMDIDHEHQALVTRSQALLSTMQKKKQEEEEMERLKRIQEEMERERKRREEEDQKRKQEEDDRRLWVDKSPTSFIHLHHGPNPNDPEKFFLSICLVFAL